MKPMTIALSAFPKSTADQETLIRTTQSLAQALAADAQSTALVLEIECETAVPLEGGITLRDLCLSIKTQGWKSVHAWTPETTRAVAAAWNDPLPNPIPERFSYGGAVLRLAVLTLMEGAEFFVRFDPGCGAPTNMNNDLQRHLEHIRSGRADVVSGRYSDRLALRDDWVMPHNREKLYRILEAFTAVNPERQIVGGAMFTARATGPLPPAFDGAKVVLSDDAFLSTLLGSRAVLDDNTVVTRSHPGFPLQCHAYICRLALMAAVRELSLARSAATAAASAKTFYRVLTALAPPCALSGTDPVLADYEIDSQMETLEFGMTQYPNILTHWPKLSAIVAQLAHGHTLVV